MSQTVLTSFFPVRKKGVEDVLKKSGQEDVLFKKRKREDEENDEGLSSTVNDSSAPLTPCRAGGGIEPGRRLGSKKDPVEEATTPTSEQGRGRVSFHKLAHLSPRKKVVASPVKVKEKDVVGWDGKGWVQVNEDGPPQKSGKDAGSPVKVQVKEVPSPLKVQGKEAGSPLKPLDYAKLEARLTPKRSGSASGMPPPLQRPAFARNLFSSEPEVRAKTAALREAVTQARELKAKLSPAEVKAKLGKVKLKDLKARLASLTPTKAEAISAPGPVRVTARPAVAPSSLVLSLAAPPPSPRKQPPASTREVARVARASPRKVPAHQRFHSLTRPLDRTLTLPYTYRLLGDVFRAVDTVVAMYYNRGEVIPLPRLEQGVRDMTKRPWRQEFLQQIRCLFPEAFTFSWRQEKWGRGEERTYCVCEQVASGEMVACDNSQCPLEWFHFACVGLDGEPFGFWFCPSCRASEQDKSRMKPRAQFLLDLEQHHRERKGNTFTLQVSPNLGYRRSLQGSDPNTTSPNPPTSPSTTSPTPVSHSTQLTAELLVARRHVFTNALLQLVKDQHRTFLSSLSPPIVVDDSLLTSWHKDFPVDSCAEIDLMPLPTHPNEEQLVPLKEPKEEEEVVEEEKENSLSAAPSSLPASLVAKVREKEAARAVREMTRSREELLRIGQLRRLPGHARAMRNLLLQERKASVSLQLAVEKVVGLAGQGGDRKEVEAELRALVVESEGWLGLFVVARQEILKIAKPHRVNEIVAMLEGKLAAAIK